MIYTFYSYKGGVGRTHLLANMAAYLCYYQQRKILMIDWDLEAPGLHYYFNKTDEQIECKGLIDLLQAHNKTVLRAPKGGTLSEKELVNPFEEKEGKKTYLQNLVENTKGGKIDLMPAIRYEEGFHGFVEDFDWVKFYDNRLGGAYLLWLKDQLKSQYDYVFIDSRTGFNDYSGICNVLMPDMNLILVAPNKQNFAGAKQMAKRIIESSYTKVDKRRKSFVLPILSRLEPSSLEAEEWAEEFYNAFAFLIPELDEDLQAFKNEEVLELISAQTVLYYNPLFAVGETTYFTEKTPRIGEVSPYKHFENIALNFLEVMNNNGEIDLNEIVKNQRISVSERNIKEDPNDYYSYFALGYAYGDLKEYKKSIEAYLKAVEIKPDYHEAWYNLGNTYRNIQEYNQAINAYQKAFEIKPDKYEAWYNLGNTYHNIQEYDKAIKAYQKAVEIKPDLHEAWNNLGNTYAEIQEYDKAIKAYQKAVKIKPDDHEAWNNLGVTYGKIQEYNQAINAYQKAVKIKPDFINPLVGIGWIYFIQGKTNEARPYFEKSISIPNSLMNLGHIALIEKKEKEAIKLYQQSLEVFPNQEEFFEGMKDDFQYLEKQGVSKKTYDEILEVLKTAKLS